MKTLENLTKALHDVQKHVIGVYYNPYTKIWEPIVEITEDTFCTITIGGLLGLQTNFYPISPENRIEKFLSREEGYASLSEMLSTPNAFNTWWKERCI